MSDPSNAQTTPDPTAEPESGAAAGSAGRDESPVEKADNAEMVMDPDAADEEPEQGARDQVERLEGHTRDHGDAEPG